MYGADIIHLDDVAGSFHRKDLGEFIVIGARIHTLL